MPNILVVDDRPANRDYLAALLTASGYETEVAADGERALTAARRARPDLVLADILMPTMDGYEFVRQMRCEPPLADVPVVFVTAHYPENDARRLAEGCGVCHIITKPAEPEQILATVRRALGVPPQQTRQAAESSSEHSRALRADRRPPTADSPLDHFQSEHRRLLTDTLARKANELEASNAQMAALLRLAQQLAAERDPKRLLSIVCHAAGEMTGAEYAVVAIADNGGGTLRHVLASGADPLTVGRISAPDAVRPLIDQAPPRGEVRIVQCPGGATASDIPAEAGTARAPDGRPRAGSVSGPLLLASLATSVCRYGILALAGLRRGDAEDGGLKRVVATLAAQTAIAYENAVRYEDIQRQAERLAQEVTERRRAQEHVQRLNDQLEQRVQQRTRELEASQQRLRQSERMAAMGTLCAGLGHDMGNLLLPIRARLRALDQLQLPESALEHVESIGQCMKYLQNLTSGLRLLALGPHDEPAASDRGSETRLGPWLNDVTPLLRSQLPRNVILEAHLPEDAVVCIGPHRLTQAVFNLVHNAAEILRKQPKGNIVLWGELEQEPGQGGFLRLGVSDDGPGMDEEIRRRAVEPFFTTKSREFSTGLGLSLVHSIVAGNGGAVDIVSAPGEGTTIVLRLPLAGHTDEESDPTAGDPPAGAEDGSKLPAPGGPAAAAVSLADARLMALAESVLRDAGYGPVSTGDGAAPGGPAGGPADTGAIWIAQAGQVSLRRARAFLDEPAPGPRGPGRRLFLVGQIDARWTALGVEHLGEDPSPSEFCRTLRECLDRSARPSGAASNRQAADMQKTQAADT